MFNLETTDVKGEFVRIKELGADVVKEPYEMGPGWIATFSRSPTVTTTSTGWLPWDMNK